ncbi:YALIA101S03e12090g1_1 [Yarrowia lipolytica]|nr:Mechanosensitive ion channel protein Msy1 [Yarrowia lipolytica]SEI33180.1 YALIA101S03e12090g1_1 [Yarrowia lipolytica]
MDDLEKGPIDDRHPAPVPEDEFNDSSSTHTNPPQPPPAVAMPHVSRQTQNPYQHMGHDNLHESVQQAGTHAIHGYPPAHQIYQQPTSPASIQPEDGFHVHPLAHSYPLDNVESSNTYATAAQVPRPPPIDTSIANEKAGLLQASNNSHHSTSSEDEPEENLQQRIERMANGTVPGGSKMRRSASKNSKRRGSNSSSATGLYRSKTSASGRSYKSHAGEEHRATGRRRSNSTSQQPGSAMPPQSAVTNNNNSMDEFPLGLGITRHQTNATTHTTGDRTTNEKEEEDEKHPKVSHVLETVFEDSDADSTDLPEIKDVMGDIREEHGVESTDHSLRPPENEDKIATGVRRGYHALQRSTGTQRPTEFKIIVKTRAYIRYLMQLSILTRCFVFWLPLAVVFFIPLAIGAWGQPDAELGNVRLSWIFIWVEVMWSSLWVSRLVAHVIPNLFRVIAGIISPTIKRFTTIVCAVEHAITLVLWAFCSWITFMPVTSMNKLAKPNDAKEVWQKNFSKVLVSCLITAIVYLCERIFIHFISVSFHKTQFANRIRDNRLAISVLVKMLDAAYMVFPQFCPEFEDEDVTLAGGLLFATTRKMDDRLNRRIQQAVQNEGTRRFFGGLKKASKSLGEAARDVIGRTAGTAASTESIVMEAMKSRSTARILGKRIWMSLVLEGQDSLTVQDIIDVVGEHSRDECEAVFAVLDQDGNGDLTLDEMSAAVTQICHERKSIYKSLKDVDCAVKKLHHILVFVVLLICIIIFVGMLSPSVGAVLATLGTTLLAFSFVFSTTCQEILSSCVFLFVKHPIDVGDRVDIADVAYNVTSLSLLYSTFTRTDNGKLCQAPNSLLNTLWIGNVSRSGLQSDPQTLILGLPETSTEDIDELHRRVDQFALDNPKDYKPKPWFQVSGFTDLDRISITINITHRSNFADIPLWGYRRTKFLKFVAQCVQEIPLYVPRREDNYSDPANSMYLSSLPPGIPGLLQSRNDQNKSPSGDTFTELSSDGRKDRSLSKNSTRSTRSTRSARDRQIHGVAPTWRTRIRPGLRVIDESEDDDDYAVESDSSEDHEHTLEEKNNTHATGGVQAQTEVQNRFKN